jgi:hypothetical protein
MQKVISFKAIYSTLKNGKRGKIIGYERASEEIIYSPEDIDKYSNIKPRTEEQKTRAAENSFMAVTGMSMDEYARKIIHDYNKHLIDSNSDMS